MVRPYMAFYFLSVVVLSQHIVYKGHGTFYHMKKKVKKCTMPVKVKEREDIKETIGSNT